MEHCVTSCHSWFSSSVSLERNLFSHFWIADPEYEMSTLFGVNVASVKYHTLANLDQWFWIFLWCLTSKFYAMTDDVERVPIRTLTIILPDIFIIGKAHHKQNELPVHTVQKISSLTAPKRKLWGSKLKLYEVTAFKSADFQFICFMLVTLHSLEVLIIW